MTDAQKVVAIFGTSKSRPGDGVFEMALKLGEVLAENGFAIANGGYGGTMLASAKGASQAGGKTIGITCTAFGRDGANEYITEEIATDSLQQRLETLVNIASAYVVLPGGTGTLLELAHIWEFKNKHFLNEQKTIIILGSFWKPLVELIGNVDTESVKHVVVASTADDVSKILKSL
jgi:uncharacterized protein (TIGR00730 family)